MSISESSLLSCLPGRVRERTGCPTGKLQKFVWNQLVCMIFLAGVGWFCVVLFEGSSPLKKSSSVLMVFLGKKQLGSTSPWIVQRSVTHMKHLHTCLAEIYSFVFTKRTKKFWRSFENGGSQDPINVNNVDYVDIVTCWPYNIVIVFGISFFLPFNSW